MLFTGIGLFSWNNVSICKLPRLFINSRLFVYFFIHLTTMAVGSS